MSAQRSYWIVYVSLAGALVVVLFEGYLIYSQRTQPPKFPGPDAAVEYSTELTREVLLSNYGSFEFPDASEVSPIRGLLPEKFAYLVHPSASDEEASLLVYPNGKTGVRISFSVPAAITDTYFYYQRLQSVKSDWRVLGGSRGNTYAFLDAEDSENEVRVGIGGEKNGSSSDIVIQTIAK